MKHSKSLHNPHRSVCAPGYRHEHHVIAAAIMLLILLLTSYACQQPMQSPATVNTISNPILAGFYPDPSICRVGENYYLVNSTFAYFPGIPIFHSKDLVNWRQLGHVLERPDQLNLEGFGLSRGLFAPAIRYHDGRYYVTCTVVDGKGNFVVTATDPAGPWSAPVYLPAVEGIDPSLFFDDDGAAYLIYNSVAPDHQPEYDGHRTIRMYRFDTHSLNTYGKEIILINKGAQPQEEPIWIEGPHILKHEGFYYLIAAEGGTSEGHSEVVFRSEQVTGPYQSYQHNTILTQRHLSADRPHPITSTGHADFVQTQTGEWWAVFLGTRPYVGNHYNTGRETFMAPVTWSGGWPHIDLGGEEVKRHYPAPGQVARDSTGFRYGGTIHFRDQFEQTALNTNWVQLRSPATRWYALQEGKLLLNTRPETCEGTSNPSFIGHRQQHMHSEASVQLSFSPDNRHEKAGLLIFQNESHYYYLAKSVDPRGQHLLELYTAQGQSATLHTSVAITDDPIKLKIKSAGAYYHFYYQQDGSEWESLAERLDATQLSTATAGGFVGCIYAMYTTSNGASSTNQAAYDWFEYTGKDALTP